MVTWEDLKISFLNNAFYYSKYFYNIHHLITNRFKSQDFSIDYLKIYKSNDQIETLNSSLELMKFANILKENIEVVEIKYYYNNTAFIVMYNNIKELDYPPNINSNDDSMTFKYKIISAILKNDVLSTINDILSDLLDKVTIECMKLKNEQEIDPNEKEEEPNENIQANNNDEIEIIDILNKYAGPNQDFYQKKFDLKYLRDNANNLILNNNNYLVLTDSFFNEYTVKLNSVIQIKDNEIVIGQNS